MFIRNANLGGTLRDIEIVETRIVGVSPPGSTPATESDFDAMGNVVIGGFADAHMHLDKSMLALRAEYQDVAPPDKGRLTREMKAQLTEEDIYRNARSVIVRAVGNGTIAIRTNVDVDPIVELRGVRALLRLREELKEAVQIQVVPFAQEGVFNYPDTPRLLREALKLGGDGVGGHTIIDKDGEGHIDTILDIAREFGVTCDFHVDESGKAEHFLLPYLAGQVMQKKLQGKVNAIHACSLSAMDDKTVNDTIALSKDAGLRFIIAPTAISTRNLTVSKALLSAGLPVNLGSDNVGDFFNPLGGAHVLHIVQLLAYVHRFFTAEEREQLLGTVTDDAEELFGRALGAGGINAKGGADITVLEGKNVREVIANAAPPLLVIRNGVTLRRRNDDVSFN